MTPDQLDVLLRAVHRRRPFRAYAIEFESGGEPPVTHPEVVTRQGEFHVFVGPDRGQHLFVAASVTRLILPPSADAR